MRSLTTLLVVMIVAASFVQPATASASVIGDACSAAGDLNSVAGKVCGFVGGGSSASSASTAIGLLAIVTWVVAGAKSTLSETTKVLGETTTPQLRSTWFSSTYWQIAGIGALLTLPFLFAAAAQAMIRSDLALLTRAAFGQLPLAILCVAIAAPLAMLLLAATDQMCSIVSSAGGAGGPSSALPRLVAGTLVATFFPKTAFVVFVVALLTTAGAIVLWLELAVREAAVYVIVLMLPLAFAAIVWPARRIWATRSVELLVALILSKLAIVAVLDLGGSALDQFGHHGLEGIGATLGGTALVLLAAFSPWAVLRLLPLSELAGSAVGSLRPAAVGGYQEVHAGQRKLGNLIDRLSAGNDGDGAGTATADGSSGSAAEAQRLKEQGSDGDRRSEVSGTDVSGSDPSDPDVIGTDVSGSDPSGPDVSGSAAAADHRMGPDTVSDAVPEQDSPSLDPVFQAADLTLEPLPLGSSADYGRVWANAGSGTSPQPSEERPGEDHQPEPPPQDPDRGSL